MYSKHGHLEMFAIWAYYRGELIIEVDQIMHNQKETCTVLS